VTYENQACNEGGAKNWMFGVVADNRACQAECQKKGGCVEWLFNHKSKNCWGYPTQHPPQDNADFDCGCKGDCGGGPTPGPHPSPGPTPLPASAVLGSAVFARFDPLFLQT